MNNRDKKMNGMDAFIKFDDKRFRVRACAIIIKDNCVLMAKNRVDDYYYSVGGAIQIGEKTEDACHREVFEETGYPYQIDKLLFIHENFFNQDETLCHEIAFYFLMKDDDNVLFNINNDVLDIKEDMVWIPIEDFYKYNAFPKFFATELKEIGTSIKVITTGK